MKTLCNFVSLLLWPRASRAAEHRARKPLCRTALMKMKAMSGNWKLDCEEICFLVFWQVSAVEAHGLLLFHRLCVVQGGCTEPVCSNPLAFVLWCPEEEYLEGILWRHKIFSLPPHPGKYAAEIWSFHGCFFPFVFKASQCNRQLLIAKQLRHSGLKQMAQNDKNVQKQTVASKFLKSLMQSWG